MGSLGVSGVVRVFNTLTPQRGKQLDKTRSQLVTGKMGLLLFLIFFSFPRFGQLLLLGQMLQDAAGLNPLQQTGTKNKLSQHFSISTEKRENLDSTEIEQEPRSDVNVTGEPAKNKVIAKGRREEHQLGNNRRIEEAAARETIPERTVSKTEKRSGPVMHEETKTEEAELDKVDGDEENEMKQGANLSKSDMLEDKRAEKEDIFRVKHSKKDQEAPPTSRLSQTCTQSPNPSTSHHNVLSSSPEMPLEAPKDSELEPKQLKFNSRLLTADKSILVTPAAPEPHTNKIRGGKGREFISTVHEGEITINDLNTKEAKSTQVSPTWKLKLTNQREKNKTVESIEGYFTHPGRDNEASSRTPSTRTMHIDKGTTTSTKRGKKRRKNDKKQKTSSGRNKISTPTHSPYFMENYCPPECACYGRMVQCSDKNIKTIPYGIPYNAIYILLMNNRINSIQLDLLSEYDSLDFLILSNNRLTDGAIEGAFERVPGLKRLYMDRNLLESVPVDLPASLEELRLDSNHLRVMAEGVWKQCPGLSVLSLSNNSLGSGSESFPIGVFSPLSNLRTLNLDHNQLASIPVDLPLSIKELYLKGNLIKRLPRGIFSGISRLMVLDLSTNRLTGRGLGKDSFLNTTHLESLNLEGNRLKQVPRHLPASIKTLNLDRNLIFSIKKAAFSSLKSMEHLSLAKNKIAKVAAGAFRALSALHQLDLSHNVLQQMPRHLPPALHSVALSHNRIQSVPRDAFCWGNETLSGLVQVHLEHNFIDFKELDVRAFSCLRGSQVVHFY